MPLDTPLSFDEWKDALHEDCLVEEKTAAFTTLNEYVLKLLWQRGLEPTVAGIASYQETAS